VGRWYCRRLAAGVVLATSRPRRCSRSARDTSSRLVRNEKHFGVREMFVDVAKIGSMLEGGRSCKEKCLQAQSPCGSLLQQISFEVKYLPGS
jgi:hypothetical protein